jgi:hypothetical protein
MNWNIGVGFLAKANISKAAGVSKMTAQPYIVPN